MGLSSCNGDDVVLVNNDTLRNDLRTLKSQVYEICQQSSADRNLCERIRTSMDYSYYPTTTTTTIRKKANVNTTKTAVVDSNKNNAAATVTVVDTV